MGNTLIREATIINEGIIRSGDVLISRDTIRKIAGPGTIKNIPGQIDVVDAKGLWLIPGVIDDQVHFRDPGFPEKGDFFTESRAAVAGGVTSVMDMPNTMPQTTTRMLLDKKIENISRKSLVNFGFYFGATNDNIEEIRKLDTSLVCGIKVFMGSSTGNMLVDDPKSLKRIFAEATIPVAVHAEDDGIIHKNLEHYKKKFGDNIPFDLHPEIRSVEACYSASTYAVELARKHGTRLHILHLSTAREMELLAPEPFSEKKKITGEVCVHHLWFCSDDYKKYGSRIKWNPAIKTSEDRDGLLKALLEDRIDVVATDHAPHTFEEKSKPYLLAPSGGPLIQHSLNVMLELAFQGKIAPEKVVEKMCHTPARLFGIRDRGFIREGYKADLVLVNPDSSWEVSTENILYKCGWSPFERTTFSSRITHTFVNGRLVYDNGLIDETHRGEPLNYIR
ncbi:MAG: dihydroorotase [Chlorobi bacterium]|nr:dihydroorotase [Chlorobiota bacterium]